MTLFGVSFAGILLLAGCASVSGVESPAESAANLPALATIRANEFVRNCVPDGCGVHLDPGTAVDTVAVDLTGRSVIVAFNDAFAQIPFRAENVRRIRERVREELGSEFREYRLDLDARGFPIEELIPNIFRPGSIPVDVSRRPAGPRALRRHVLNADRPVMPTRGLDGRHIAIWPSHGWYYEASLDRWEWQRSRLFQTVEDLLPMSFVVPYLEPMLRRAGASVYLPRERDVQANEVIVDNDTAPDAGRSRYVEHAPRARDWYTPLVKGFGAGDGLLNDGMNPFAMGTARATESDTETTAYVEWIPDIPESGEYAVYVSYAALPGATTDARYTVYHEGGSTTFVVDQTMGGGTWTYLGTFRFEEGVRPISGRVTLDNAGGSSGSLISADAVRFGGGMGNVVRGRTTSGRPRFAEGARYYMQFSGMPDSLVYNVTESLNDYTDDYRGRAEWVNFLRGAPQGPNKDRTNAGLGIPIDLSLAFHTDAGITRSDSTIGTLMIYSTEGFEKERLFPDGIARVTNRDLGDIIQTQIVDDVRALYDSHWNRRSIWDRDYSEAVRPNVPGVLLELLSHQNYADMKFGLDPRFRFHVCRAIYKALLRYLASQSGEAYTVQPLGVTNAYAEFVSSDEVHLHWSPRSDPLEPTAEPSGYIVYTRKGDTDFDNGRYVDSPEFVMGNLERDVVYSFRIAATNAGGESEPSEVLAVGLTENAERPVLVVNGFDRISAPATLEKDEWRGFAGFLDEGVPEGHDAAYVGEQYDFDVNSPWLDDDAPGHGASYATYETQVLTGNTFDYAAIHGEALMAAGRSFVTASNESVAERQVELDAFSLVDIILGEQRATNGAGDRRGVAFRTFSLRMQAVLEQYVERGGDLFVSGAYVGTDLFGPSSREDDRRFGERVLRMKWRTDHASHGGEVHASSDDLLPFGTSIAYNLDPTGPVYRVESPDALEPIDAGGKTLLRYGDNNVSAAYGYRSTSSVVVFGFPFETILAPDDRWNVMRSVLDYLNGGE